MTIIRYEDRVIDNIVRKLVVSEQIVKEGKKVTFKRRLFPGGINEINKHKSCYNDNNKNPIVITKGKT